MSNLQASLRQNQTHIGQLDRDSFENLKNQNQYSNSVMTFVYIFLIGIAFSLFTFLIEYFGNWCLKREVPQTEYNFYKNKFGSIWGYYWKISLFFDV